MVTASGLSAPQPCQDRRRGETVGNEPDRGLVVAHRRARVADILAVCLEEGMRTLKQDGMEKCLTGVTHIKEVRSVCIK